MTHLEDRPAPVPEPRGVEQVATALGPWISSPRGSCALIGVTGGVAVGKSTFADALAAHLDTRRDGDRSPDGTTGGGGGVARLGTDAFLYRNAELAARGLTERKGFPESYDRDALRATLVALGAGERVAVPRYRHDRYDVVDGVLDPVGPAWAVVVDGLHLARLGEGLFDVVVALDAPEAAVRAWFLSRFRALRADAAADPDAFYRWAADIAEDDAVAVAEHLWTTINLVNLHDHVDPDRELADLVVALDGHHRVVSVTPQRLPPVGGAAGTRS